MPFGSILFEQPADRPSRETREQPPSFTDLNLDQVLAALTRNREQYDLAPFFLTPLHTESAVRYRHSVFQDLARPEVRAAVDDYARGFDQVRQYLHQSGQLRVTYQKERWFVDAVDAYGQAVTSATEKFGGLDLTSAGLKAFRDYLGECAQSEEFSRLTGGVRDVLSRLAEVRYCVHIRGTRVRVTRYEDEPDYGADVEATFAKFKQGAVEDHRMRFQTLAEMDHVEAQILELVGRLFPEVFAELDAFCQRNQQFVDDTLGMFDREVQFYLAYTDYQRPMEAAGLPFCFPEVSGTSREIRASDAFDLALAAKLTGEQAAVVPNSFQLSGPERALVVTGPNQGGKTTFARMYGQLPYLASLGLPVPARSARLFLPDQLFTHFEKEEDLQSLRGKLEDELMRIHDILQQATGRSIVVMNESFSSTTLQDASFLGAEILGQLTECGLLCLYVTFIDELASLNDACVSMVAEIVPDIPAMRTHRIVRKPADGLAYAVALARKYGLTYERLKERVAS